MAFIKKQLKANETVGSYLNGLLLEEAIDVRTIAKHLHMQPRQIEALLRDDFDALPGVFYTRHLLRLVATALHGNVEYAEKLYRKHNAAPEESPKSAFERKKVTAGSLLVTSRLIAGSFLGIVLFSLLGYFGLNIRHALEAPVITLMNPAGDVVTAERTISIEGKTEPEVALKVNGMPVTLDNAGVFTVPLYLDDGLNVIEIRAAKRYSKEQIIYRRILVESKKTGAVSVR